MTATDKGQMKDIHICMSSEAYDQLTKADDELYFVPDECMTEEEADEKYATLTALAGKQDALTAGTGISISASKVISNTGITDVTFNGESVATGDGTAEIPVFVTGSHDGTNWIGLTINGVSKAIPQGGSGSGRTVRSYSTTSKATLVQSIKDMGIGDQLVFRLFQVDDLIISGGTFTKVSANGYITITGQAYWQDSDYIDHYICIGNAQVVGNNITFRGFTIDNGEAMSYSKTPAVSTIQLSDASLITFS